MFAEDSPFGVRVLHQQSHTVILVAGEVDLATAPRLRSYFHDVIADADGAILLDLAEVTFLDSTGLCEILTAYAELDEQDRELRVVKASMQVRRVFEVCGITDLVVDDPQASGTVVMSV